MVTLVGTWVSFLIALPRPVLMLFALATASLIVIFSVMFSVGTKEPSELMESFSLTFTPHCGNTPLLSLEVRNNGNNSVNVSASIRVLSRNTGEPVNTRPYRGLWTNTQQKLMCRDDQPPKLSTVKIAPGDSRLLEIARQDPNNGTSSDISHADLINGRDVLRWDYDNKTIDVLPAIRLQIDFFKVGSPIFVRKTYDVSPTHACGPLKMTEVSV